MSPHNWHNLGRTLANFGCIRAKVGQSRSNSGRMRSKFAQQMGGNHPSIARVLDTVGSRTQSRRPDEEMHAHIWSSGG